MVWWQWHLPHVEDDDVTSMYSAISDEQVQRLARLRHRSPTVTDARFTIFVAPADDDDDTVEPNDADEQPDEDEPDTYQRPDVCAECGGRIYALQNCLRCFPVVELGSKTRAETMNPDTQRKMTARADGRRFYKSMTPCKTCSDPEPTRHCVGDRCVVCTAAAAARGEYNEVATVPIVVLPKPKRVRTYTPKPVAPIKVAAPPKPPVDRHAPKSEQHRARIAAAAWRRYHPDTLSR
jgi:hypothetical protein